MEQTPIKFSEMRERNDASLLPQIAAIRSGQSTHALEQFARAYLGLYMNIEITLTPRERLALMANRELRDAVLEGFANTVTSAPLPAVEEIAEARARGQEQPINFIGLAGANLLAEQSPESVLELPEDRLRSLLCFYFASTAEVESIWYQPVVQARPETVAAALASYWGILIDRGATYLPGLLSLLHEQSAVPVISSLSLTLLKRWKQCRVRLLVQLLDVAFRYADEHELRQLVETMLADQDRVNVKKTLLWMAAAFLLTPEQHEQQLIAYCQSSKEKILPLLDFCYLVMQPGNGRALVINAHALAVLLRIIGPKFPPKVIAGEPGDSISQKVLWMFQQLSACPAPDAMREIKWLRGARVMHRCDSVLDAIESHLD
jgi:hypothetical protein